MRRMILCFALLLAAACAPAASTRTPPTPVPTDAPSGPVSAVPYPANYRDTFLQYVTVDRKDAVVRYIYVSPNAIASLQASRRIPDHTIIVVEAYDAQRDANGDPITDADGHFIAGDPLPMLHVAEKRSDWQAGDFPSAARSGQWNFASFQIDGSARFDEDLNACFNCHMATQGTDFIYTANLLAQYARSGQTLYSYCNQRRRITCQN